ncbi:nephrin isoform X1 [Parasteatoda tepidariorum]
MMCWIYIVQVFFFISSLLKGFHCQQQYIRARPNDTEIATSQNVEFQCHVANKDGPVQWNKEGIVLIPPQTLSINDLPPGNNIEVRQGDKVVLYCKAVGSKPPTQLVWYKNDNELFDEDAQMSFDEDKHRRYTTTSSITLYPGVDDNGAIYSCEARHPALERYLRCSVAINVLHAPGIPQIEGYIEGDVVTSGDTLTLACITRGGNPPPHLIWKRGNVQVDATYTVSGHVTTNIHTFRVDASDNNGVYRCEASSIMTKEPIAASVKLSVHFPPSNVKLIGPLVAKKSDTVTMTCSTEASNPPSQITWVVDGSRVVGGESVTNRVADGWVTASNLTITLTRQDPDVKSFSCYAENPPVRKKTFRTHKLTVTSDPPQPPTILGYEEGQPLKVGELQTFNCVSLGGNPPASLKWFRGDREVRLHPWRHISTPTVKTGSGVSSELVIRVDPSDNGMLYKCEANNTATQLPLVAFIKTVVFFPPSNVTITLKPCDPKAGDEVTLTCLSSGSNPLARITWKRDGRHVRDHTEETLSADFGAISTRSVLTFPVTSADDKTIFECKAKSDDLPAVITNVTIRVRHKPEFPEPYQRVDVAEGTNATVNISVNAYPDVAWFSWTRDSSLIPPMSEMDDHLHRVMSSGPVLYILNVARKDAGTYICMAENEEGTSNATIILNVQYPAVVTNITTRVLVAEGENAYFECSISANPIIPDMIRWSTKGGAIILRENQQFTENGRSLLTLFNVSKQDSGTLECEAFNGIGEPDIKIAHLIVQYKPTIVRNLVNPKVATELSSTVELRCIALGDGNVTFVWSFNSTVIIQGLDIGRYNIRAAEAGDLQWCSVLTIKRVRPDDYGEYTCVAKNHLGYDFVKFSLSKKGAPEPPKELKAMNESTDSITLVWSPGFDGGSDQNFRIRFKKSDASTYNYKEAPTNTTSVTITGLEPGAQYDFFIAAYNNIGESAYAENVLTVSTREVKVEVTTKKPKTFAEKEIERKRGTKMWLITSILGGVSFVVSCIMCVCFVWKKCSLITSEVIIPIAQLQAAQEEAFSEVAQNRLLIQPEPKQTAPLQVGIQNETTQEQVQLRDIQQAEQRAPSWEETARNEYNRTRSLSFDRKCYEEGAVKEIVGSVNNLQATATAEPAKKPEETPKCLGETKVKTKGSDIRIRRKKKAVEFQFQEPSDLSSSPRSTSPESPRYSSTTSSESSDTRSSVYHEKTSLHSLHSLHSLRSLHSLHSLRSTLSLSRSANLRGEGKVIIVPESRGLEYITVKHSHPIVLINIESAASCHHLPMPPET